MSIYVQHLTKLNLYKCSTGERKREKRKRTSSREREKERERREGENGGNRGPVGLGIEESKGKSRRERGGGREESGKGGETKKQAKLAYQPFPVSLDPLYFVAQG